MLVTSVNKGVQGRFLTWQNTMQLDLLNYNYKMSPALLKFHLNSTDDVANTLLIWTVELFEQRKTCNIKHILTVCSISRNSKRYNCRHDNFLRVIAGALLDQLETYNSAVSTSSDKEWLRFKLKDGS